MRGSDLGGCTWKPVSDVNCHLLLDTCNCRKPAELIKQLDAGMVRLPRSLGGAIGVIQSGSLLPDLQWLYLGLGDLKHRRQLPNAVRQCAGAEVAVVFLDHGGVRVTQLGSNIG